MKLILEKSDRIYLYIEQEGHHEIVEPDRARTLNKCGPEVLKNTCDLTFLPDNTYIVFDIKLPER